MWKFFRESSGTTIPNSHDSWEQICDALGWVLRQEPGPGNMTILGRIGPVQGHFGRPRGVATVEAWRFTKKDATAAAVFAAQQVAAIYERFAPGDGRVEQAIAAARDGYEDMFEAERPAALAAIDARHAADGAAEYAAESAKAAVLAAGAHDDGTALHALAYGVGFAIQAAYKVSTGDGDTVTNAIENWLRAGLVRLTKVRV